MQFKIVKFIHFDTESNEDKNEKKNDISNENNIKDSNNKNIEISQQVTSDKKGKNGSVMPLNEQNLNNNNNLFEILNQKN